MSDSHKFDVKRRFDAVFGIDRLPMFEDFISSLEANGQQANAEALKTLMEEDHSPDL